METMPTKATLARAAIGFRVKSGWATAVLLAGPTHSPRVVDHRVIHLSDPAVPESRQPYHAGMGTLDEDDAKIKPRIKVVQRITNGSVAALLDDYRNLGCKLRGAALVVGSLIEPSSIKNPHIRAHALEGQLFRTVLDDALRLFGLPCSVVVERNAYSEATTVLKRSEDKLKRAVSDLGRGVSGRWRADEKLAALAAWMTLA